MKQQKFCCNPSESSEHIFIIIEIVMTLFFCFQKSIGNVTHWRCSVRNTKVCKASVVQIGSFFHMHKFKHDHEPNPTQRLSSKVIAKLKHIIRLPQYKFRGTADIVREVLQSFASMEHIDRLNKSYLDRIVSRERQNLKNLGNGKKPWETDSDVRLGSWSVIIVVK